MERDDVPLPATRVVVFPDDPDDEGPCEGTIAELLLGMEDISVEDSSSNSVELSCDPVDGFDASDDAGFVAELECAEDDDGGAHDDDES